MLRVGVFANTHGIAGEIKVFPTTDNVERFKKVKKSIHGYRNRYVGMGDCQCEVF